MSANRNPGQIRIGLVADEPIRLAGLVSIFDQPARDGHAGLVPVPGQLAELLAGKAPRYLVVDLNSYSSGLKALEGIRRARPDIRLIVIGPAGDDELVLNSIIAGARAYLDLNAGPEMVRMAIEVVTEGSIWAPRRLLSQLIDRLLKVSDPSLPAAIPKLTTRERQVLELILMARSNREIAFQLGIEERTVRAHLGRLMRKAGVDNRIKLSMSARSLFMLPHGSGSRGGRPERARCLVIK
ncbi:MAG TPA: response regulator transcription factor [Terracidiphilus sp.]|nr:response regulator transcription factor [Terracidiphilus sp.]